MVTEVLSPTAPRGPHDGRLDPVHAFALRLDAYRRQVEHEDELINHRISWLVSSAAFLFAAFALLSTSRVTDGPLDSTSVRWLLLVLIQALGLLMAVLVHYAVGAATSRLDKLHEDFGRQVRIDPEIARQFPNIACDEVSGELNRRQLDRGRIPSTWIPPMLAAAWLATLITSIVVTVT